MKIAHMYQYIYIYTGWAKSICSTLKAYNLGSLPMLNVYLMHQIKGRYIGYKSDKFHYGSLHYALYNYCVPHLPCFLT